MESFILRLAVAVIPLVVLITAITFSYNLYSWYIHHPLTLRRTRRHILSALASGIMLR